MMSHTLRQLVCVFSILSVVSSFAQTTDWVFTTDNNGREVALDIARDPSQHCFYVAGFFEGQLSEAFTYTSSSSADVSLNLLSVGGTDAFVARLSDAGELEWIQVIGSANDDKAITVSVGANGLVYVGGYVSGPTITQGASIGANLTGNPGQPFLVKFNPDGQWVGGESYPTTSSAMVADLECDPTSIHVLFHYRNQSFSSAQFSIEPDTQYQVQKRSYQNTVVWQASFGAPGSTIDVSAVEYLRPKIAVHNGDVFLVGEYDANGFTVVASADNSADAVLFPIDNGYRIFIASLAQGGTLNWIQTTTGVIQMPQGFGLDADCSGVYLGGAFNFTNATKFPGDFSTGGTPQETMFVAKLNISNGNTEWLLKMSSTGGVKDDVVTSIACDDYGTILCGGFLKMGLQLPGLTTYSGDEEDAVLFACDSEGAVQWGKFYPGDDKDRIFGMACADAGRVAFCGESGRGFELLQDIDVQDGDNAVVGLYSYATIGLPVCCTPAVGGIISSPNLSPCAGEPLVIYHNLLEEQRVVQYSLLGFGWTNVATVTQNPMVINNPSQGFYRIVTTYPGCGTANSNILQMATGLSVSLTCPVDKYVFANASCQFVLPDYTGEVIIAGACAVDFVQTPAAGTILGLGDHTITIEAQVTGVALTSCQFQIDVADGTPPSLVCPTAQTRFTAAGCEYTIEDFRSLVSFSDNCGEVTLTQDPGIGNTYTRSRNR